MTFEVDYFTIKKSMPLLFCNSKCKRFLLVLKNIYLSLDKLVCLLAGQEIPN